MLAAQVLLDLEHGVNALGRDVPLIRLVVEKRGVLPVVDHDVDLFTAGTPGVDHERSISLVPPRQVVA
jgi:hypothetical protein